jgi:hypothetical protein
MQLIKYVWTWNTIFVIIIKEQPVQTRLCRKFCNRATRNKFQGFTLHFIITVFELQVLNSGDWCEGVSYSYFTDNFIRFFFFSRHETVD